MATLPVCLWTKTVCLGIWSFWRSGVEGLGFSSFLVFDKLSRYEDRTYAAEDVPHVLLACAHPDPALCSCRGAVVHQVSGLVMSRAGDRTTRAAQIRRTHAAGSAIGVGIMSSTILLQSLHN